MSTQVLFADSHGKAVFFRVFPRTRSVRNQILLPEGMTLEQVSSVLRRVGYEAWSRFPGQSVRIRPYRVRKRGGYQANLWDKDVERMLKKNRVFPCYDELYSTKLNQAFVKQWRKLTDEERITVEARLERIPDLLRYRRGGQAYGQLFTLLDDITEKYGLLAEYVFRKKFALHLTYVRPYAQPLLFMSVDARTRDANSVISNYLNMPQGRSRLAAAMIAPLRARRDEQSILRRAFMVEDLPSGRLPDDS